MMKLPIFSAFKSLRPIVWRLTAVLLTLVCCTAAFGQSDIQQQIDSIKQLIDRYDQQDSMLVHSGHRGLIASTDTPLDSYGRYYSPEQFTSSDGVTFKIYKQWTSVNINNIINFAKNQGLDIKVEESDGQGE